MFKVFSVDTRVRIVELLKVKGAMTVNNIAKAVGITPAAASQHLKVLKGAGLVTSERKGYWIPYSIDEDAMEECKKTMSKVCSCCGPDEIRVIEVRMDSDLESLEKYERNLEEALKDVRARIKKAKG
jgi:DNA-binding transcriptional ArsR family regulator